MYVTREAGGGRGSCATSSCWEGPAFVVTVVVGDPAGPMPRRTSPRVQCWTHALAVSATIDALVLDGALPEGSYAEQVVCEDVSPLLDLDALWADRGYSAPVTPHLGVPGGAR